MNGKSGIRRVAAALSTVLFVCLSAGCFGGAVEGVHVAEVTRGDAGKIVSAVGVLEAAQPVDVIPPLGGTIAALNVKEGDQVSAGDVLATLDQRELEAQAAQAEADYLTNVSIGDVLEGQWNNSLAMYSSMEYASESMGEMQGQVDAMILGFYDMVPAFMPYVPPDEQEYLKAILAEERERYVEMMDSRQPAPGVSYQGYPASAAAADQARVNAAQYQYEETMQGAQSPDINAPVSGYVIFAPSTGIMPADMLSDMLGGLGSLTSSLGMMSDLAGGDLSGLLGGGDTGAELKVGSRVSAGQPLFQIMDLQDMRVLAQVEETDIPLIQEGQAVEVFLDAYPDLEFSGEVIQVGVVSEAGSSGNTVFRVTIQMGRTEVPLRLGYNATVDIKVLEKVDIIDLPITALLEEDGEEYVYAVEDGKAYRREIVTGDRSDEWVEVVSGLEEGERIVVEGAGKVEEGQKVE